MQSINPSPTDRLSVTRSSSARPITRRGLFAVAGALAAGALTGCNPFSQAPETITVTTQAAPPTSVLMGLIFKARLHVDHVAAAVARNDENVDRYRMILADREAHMTALLEENARAGGDASVIPPAADIAQVDIPDEAAELLALIRDDAGQAQTNFTDAALSATPYQAQLLAAIAACVASHRAVLA